MKINYLDKDFFAKNHKSILIYNPFSNIGHFDSWCKIFVDILLKKGWTVCVVTNNPKMLLENISVDHNYYLNNLVIIDKDASFGDGAIHKLSKSFIFSKTPFLKFKSYENKISLFFKKTFNLIINNIYLTIQSVGKTRISLSFNDPRDFARDVGLISKSLGGSPAIVLNMYLDLYNSNPKVWEQFAKLMKYEWAGIHMDLNHTLIDKPYSKSNSLKAIYSINEPTSLNTPKSVFKFKQLWLPDATDTSLPSFTSKLAQNILKDARGRSILFLGGSIGGSKNLSLWFELVLNANNERWFFVLVGKLDFQTLTTKDLDGLEILHSMNFENVYISDGYLDDESIFNELINLSSVVWGIYRDFDRSSNILTKAALFSKPIVVSKNYLMGQRVTQYKIGRAVSEIDVQEALHAINWLIANPIDADNFKEYAAVYSTLALADKLDQSLIDLKL